MVERNAILAVLSDGKWWRGLDIVRESGGLVSRGTVYLRLLELEDEGIIESLWEPDNVRRIYRKVD